MSRNDRNRNHCALELTFVSDPECTAATLWQLDSQYSR